MKRVKSWGQRPFKPVFFESGDIYICRLAPSKHAIHVEWLPLAEQGIYSVYCRPRDCGEYVKVGETTGTEFDITELEDGQDFEFYVEASGKKSRVRLARTGDAVGTVVNYLHPDDEAYIFSGSYLCSPSFVRLPNGTLVSSMDVYGDPESNYASRNLLLLFSSEDEGKTWHYLTDVFPAYWGKLFVHQKNLYLIAGTPEFGDLLIGKSTDGGKTWSEPATLLHGNGPYTGSGPHKSPMPVVEYNGRLWHTLEWGPGKTFGPKTFSPMVMSVPVDADLLDSDNWTFSEPLVYDPNWEGVAKGHSDGNMEGCLVVIDGQLYNIMRFMIGAGSTPSYGLILSFKVDTEHPEKPLQYDRAIEFPCNRSRFEIKYDEVSKKYFSIGNRITDPSLTDRRLLTLMVSDDCIHWSVLKDLIDGREYDPMKTGFQYVEFYIEGDDIIFLCRVGMNEPHSFHDANYQTFHRIENFRQFLEDAEELPIFHVK